MGQFQPGQDKPAGSGRRRGARNKKSQHLADQLAALGLDVPGEIVKALPELNAGARVDVLMDLMNYLFPKRKAIEHSGEVATIQPPVEPPEDIEVIKARLKQKLTQIFPDGIHS